MIAAASAELVSDDRQRRQVVSPSSGAMRGLNFTDIIKYKLLADNQSNVQSSVSATSVLGENVFNALAAAKVWTSNIAMHLDREARDRYFRQIDLLHDDEEWVDGDQPLQLESYKGFVRFMLMVRGKAKPALALSSKGQLIAVWRLDADRLTIEFSSGNAAEWVVSHRIEERTERAAGSTTLSRLLANLEPYRAKEWFGIE